MAAKMSARREAARAGRARLRGLPAEPLSGLIAWRVDDINGVPNLVYTLTDVKPHPSASKANVQ
jgi:hypothetical protein